MRQARYRPLWTWMGLVALGSLVATSLLGCATPEASQAEDLRPGETRLRVASFEIEGTEHFGARAIKKGLATQQDPGWRTAIAWMPLLGGEPQYFNRLDWERDLQRIHTFYHARGFFNARIVSQQIIESREDQTVDITIRIDEGQPARVNSVHIDGLDPLSAPLRRRVLSDLSVQEGETFTQHKYLATRQTLVRRLEAKAFAHASVSGRAVVDPQANTVDVFYFLDPGPRARFGEIHIVGNEIIPTRYIRSAIGIEPGELYSGTALERAQDDVYALQVFSLVSVLPAHEARPEVLEQAGISPERYRHDPTGEPPPAAAGGQPPDGPVEEVPEEVREEIRDIEDDDVEAPGPLGISDVIGSAQQQAEARVELEREVPVIVRLKESRMWSVEVGTGFSIESNRSSVHGQANWLSRNFLGGLRRLEHFNTFGYAWAYNASETNLVAPFGIGRTQTEGDNEGIFLSSRLQFRQPRFIEQNTTLTVSPSVRRTIELGYKAWNPRGSVGLERTFFRHLTVGLSYHLSYFSFTDITETLLTATPLGVDFREKFLLEWIEQRLALDYRDNPLDPRRGFYSQLQFQQAGSYAAGGEFQYLRLIWGNEAYLPFRLLTDWVLAGRVRVGAVYNTEAVEDDGQGDSTVRRVPALSRLYSGGRGRMRSVGHNNVSVFRVGSFDPTLPDDIDSVEVIPVGGLSMMELSVEPRFRLIDDLAGVGDLWGSVYYDAATVLDGQLAFETEASRFIGLESVAIADLTDTLLHGVGTGLFWLTPVGPVRADFAVTLNDLSDDPRFRTCGPPSRVRQEVTETGRSDCVFLPVDRDPVQQQLNLSYSFFVGIGHSF